MKYETLRITSVEELLYYKDQIIKNLVEVSSSFPLQVDQDFWFKTVCKAVTSTTAYVGIVLTNESGVDASVVACGIAQDVTPQFYEHRVAMVGAVFFKKGYKKAVFALQDSFEKWCRSRNIKSYFFLSTRQSGAATECFNEFGLNKKSAIYVKGV